jgi:hypothetical protein
MKTKTNMHVRLPFARKCNLGAALMLVLLMATVAHAQLTPIGDAYTNTADPTTNYGAKTVLDVESASQTSYIQFNLSSIPSGYTGADITKATLKLYVNAVTKAGSFNVDYVNGTWSEGTIDANNAPALGSTIVASVPLTTADKNQYILIDITAALQAWLNGSQANDGIALVGNSPVNASFDSKESTTTSHAAELDIVFVGGGTITGVTTASGSGLMGGGTSGTLSLSLTNACAANQVLQWNGTAWACVNLTGSGTITGVTAGTDLTGGGTSGNVTLNLDTTKVPQLNTANTFTQLLTVTTTNNTGLGTITGNNASSFYATAAVEGNATFTGTGSTIGVEGYSQSTAGWGVYGIGGAAGVYGGSTLNGVFGNSTTGNGVYGQTAGAGGSGVYGTNSAGGTGVSGKVPAGGTGVYGENQSTSVGGDGMLGKAHTNSGNGVHGINDASTAVGVYGENSATNGYGVYGHAPNGYGMATDSNASQARTMGGWVKAMVYVDPFKGGIQRCFNSQLPGSQATTVPCGITYTRNEPGNYTIDFGFQVDDRFLAAATPYSADTVAGCLDDYCSGVTPTQVGVSTYSAYSGSEGFFDTPFFLTIF